jgi:hypothetical protein
VNKYSRIFKTIDLSWKSGWPFEQTTKYYCSLKWDPIISKAVENATSKWGFPPSGGNTGREVSCSQAVSVLESGSIGPRRATLYISYKYHVPKATGWCIHQTNWDVPADFDFQTVDLYVAWTAWLLGYPSNQSKKADGVIYPAPVRLLSLKTSWPVSLH